jgi:hypothetical protein
MGSSYYKVNGSQEKTCMQLVENFGKGHMNFLLKRQ